MPEDSALAESSSCPAAAVEADNQRTSLDREALRQSFNDHLRSTRGHSLDSAPAYDRYVALVMSVRDRLLERRVLTERAYADAEAKRVCYLSAEFLTGRLLLGNLQALGIERSYRELLRELCIDLDELLEQEPEPGLGNGGLGRLAACFVESMASMGLPGTGYGIRYEFGIFEQAFRDGRQVERADEWLRFGNPWEVERPDHAVEVRFGGHTEVVPSEDGGYRVVWAPQDTVLGVRHDLVKNRNLHRYPAFLESARPPPFFGAAASLCSRPWLRAAGSARSGLACALPTCVALFPVPFRVGC